MRRRDFVKTVVSAGGAALISSCGGPPRADDPRQRRVLVVAFDGLDPRIVQSLMGAGRMPNFERLAAAGSMTKIATSTPPHTPVAFSNIISGADPGMHHIFDFIHRKPNPAMDNMAVEPYFSTSEVQLAEHKWLPETISLGQWQLPLSGGETKLLRRGPAFWNYLIEHGIDTDIYYLPSNYPVQTADGPGRLRAIGGMGTPDLLGGYGEFTLFTPDVSFEGKEVGGGRFVHLTTLGNRARARLTGPLNFLREADASGRVPPLTVTLDVVRDSTESAAKIDVAGRIVLLAEGQWSDWIPIDFQTGIPGSTVLGAVGAPTSVRGMVRIFLKKVHPKLEFYVSPINIDPAAPINQITAPEDFSRELAKRNGRFSTQGIPEDTKALSHGALNEDQFLAQSDLAMDERIAQYRQMLADFRRGCVFFYFGATDLVQHMFWRDRDPEHPGRKPGEAERYGHVIDDLYVQVDGLVGEALDWARPGDTLIVLSDHGFTTFRRGFNLNTWLLENKFLSAPNITLRNYDVFPGVDWAKTTAYGLGMNALYVNMRGREKHGSVDPDRQRSLLEQIRDGLMKVRDHDGAAVIENVELVEDFYPAADRDVAPDMIIGYANGYRASWDTILGKMPRELIEDNLDRWSGEHLIDADLVPGVLAANRPIAVEDPTLRDIAPTILSLFGISKPSQMTGRMLFDLDQSTSRA